MLNADADYALLRQTGQPGWGGAAHDRRLSVWTATLDRIVAENLIPPAPVKVLELGCGNGSMSFELARRGYAVDGIDISREAIDWARELAPEAGAAVTFRQGDVCAMPGFAGASFDVVIDGACLHCVIGDDRARALSEVRRVLCAGGTFVVSTMCGEPKSDDARARFDRAARVLLNDGKPYRVLKPAETIEAEVAGAGFRIVDRSVAVNPWWDHLTLVCVSP